jgi:hypothetical protein
MVARPAKFVLQPARPALITPGPKAPKNGGGTAAQRGDGRLVQRAPGPVVRSPRPPAREGRGEQAALYQQASPEPVVQGRVAPTPPPASPVGVRRLAARANSGRNEAFERAHPAPPLGAGHLDRPAPEVLVAVTAPMVSEVLNTPSGAGNGPVTRDIREGSTTGRGASFDRHGVLRALRRGRRASGAARQNAPRPGPFHRVGEVSLAMVSASSLMMGVPGSTKVAFHGPPRAPGSAPTSGFRLHADRIEKTRAVPLVTCSMSRHKSARLPGRQGPQGSCWPTITSLSRRPHRVAARQGPMEQKLLAGRVRAPHRATRSQRSFAPAGCKKTHFKNPARAPCYRRRRARTPLTGTGTPSTPSGDWQNNSRVPGQCVSSWGSPFTGSAGGRLPYENSRRTTSYQAVMTNTP